MSCCPPAQGHSSYPPAPTGLSREEEGQGVGGQMAEEERETARHLRLTKAAEVRVVKNAQALREPPVIDGFKARGVRVESDES